MKSMKSNKMFIVFVFLLILIWIGVFVWLVIFTHQPVSLPAYMMPHLAMAGFFSNPNDMKGMDGYRQRERQYRGTKKLFSVIIWIMLIGFLLMFFVMGLSIS